MVPTPVRLSTSPHSSRLFLLLYTIAKHYVAPLFSGSPPDELALGMNGRRILAKRIDTEPHDAKFIVFAVLIPVLVLLSGVFAGLTLGYMSLDETQLNVLSISGTAKQRLYANKIKPIRKNGHLLLVTLLLANMITNETLPVISAPVLGGGVQSVVVSTVLIVIFAEIIPQSLCTRHGLYLGAKMARPTQFLIYALGIISWPVAKLLEWVLGPHHGIIYRRAELKELIAMHSSLSPHGGDLKNDTVTIIGATLDLQEKVVMQAMTPISDVFMLHIDSKLDYELLKKICQTGHSRVPVYEEVDIPVPAVKAQGLRSKVGKESEKGSPKTEKAKKIVGILLVKQCVLLDPKDAVPLRRIPLNKVPFVPKNMPLLGILDKFQEGRSHMAIVSRLSVDINAGGKAQSVKGVVKRGLTHRLMQRVGMGDDSSDSEDEDEKKARKSMEEDGEATLKGDTLIEEDYANGNGNAATLHTASAMTNHGRTRTGASRQNSATAGDLEMGVIVDDSGKGKLRRSSFGMGMGMVQIPFAGAGLEQRMPADAVLGKEGFEDFLQGIDPAVMPMGIITLEDVLEELIGEEIYDEFDTEGGHASYVPPEVAYNHNQNISAPGSSILRKKASAPQLLFTSSPQTTDGSMPNSSVEGPPSRSPTTTPVLKPIALKGLSFLASRPRSAPSTPRDQKAGVIVPGTATGRAATPSSPPRTTSPPIIESNSLQSSMMLSPLTPAMEDEERERNQSLPTPAGMLEVTADPPLPMLADLVEDTTVAKVENDAKKPKVLPTGGVPTISTLSGSVAASKSGSPAPPLEAILLDRKRRLVAAGGVQVAPPPSIVLPAPASVGPVPANPRVGTPIGIKGQRFKSSPLGGGERTGVVVAEQLKEDLTRSHNGSEDMRIPDGKHKAGPDKGAE